MENPTSIPIITACVSLVSVAVGAFIQNILSRKNESEKHQRELKFKSYAEYMQSVGEAETMKLIANPERHAEILGKAISAKAKVCLHGSEKAVKALSNFESIDREKGLTKAKKEKFVEFVNHIRTESNFEGTELKSEVVRSIMFADQTVSRGAEGL